MKTTTTRRVSSLLIFLIFALTVCCPFVEAFRRQNQTSASSRRHNNKDDSFSSEDIPQVGYLIELIGKEFYAAVDTPKYKFYIYMTIGTLPSEQATIVLVSTVCNTLYGLSILLGFLLFKRGPMLVFTVATLWIGPALVLLLLGALGMMVAAFALYPTVSVSCITLWFFLSSQLAQKLGKDLGLDSDGDGDVDWLDLLHAIGKTEIGGSIGLLKLHDFLNQCKLDPFKEIHLRLDRIHHNTTTMNSSQRKISQEQETDSNKKTL